VKVIAAALAAFLKDWDKLDTAALDAFCR